jgi:hypothetical protein
VIIGAALGLFFFALFRGIQQKKKYGIEVKKQEIISSSVIAVVGLGLAFMCLPPIAASHTRWQFLW